MAQIDPGHGSARVALRRRAVLQQGSARELRGSDISREAPFGPIVGHGRTIIAGCNQGEGAPSAANSNLVFVMEDILGGRDRRALIQIITDHQSKRARPRVLSRFRPHNHHRTTSAMLPKHCRATAATTMAVISFMACPR
jgi:hypothetical protein